MEMRFQPHAVSRMLERNLSVELIERIILTPDGKIRQTKDKTIFYKKITGRKDNSVAAVVVEKYSGNIYEIVTVLVNFEVKKL